MAIFKWEEKMNLFKFLGKSIDSEVWIEQWETEFNSQTADFSKRISNVYGFELMHFIEMLKNTVNCRRKF